MVENPIYYLLKKITEDFIVKLIDATIISLGVIRPKLSTTLTGNYRKISFFAKEYFIFEK